MHRLLIDFCKIVSVISKKFGIGAGATWPGEIALRIKPDILSSLSADISKGIILVAGTNGKTTTALMLNTILEAQGMNVVHNASGANLLNGIISSCIQKTSWTGELHADYGVFEVDENSLPTVISNIQYPITNKNKKLIIVLLNLFRDQLDRYGEVDVIAKKWVGALDPQRSKDRGNEIQIIANADDPLIAFIAQSGTRPGPSTSAGRLEAKIRYFGLDDPAQYMDKMEHATDSIFCPKCGTRLMYKGVYYSHIGDWHCPECKNKRPQPDISMWDYPLPGLYNRYNTLAAVATTQVLGIKHKKILQSLQNFKPAFGRQEEFVIDQKKVKIFLAKNPAGFNESIRTVLQLGAKNILFVLNDRIPDGRDISWIWDVDFELLNQDEHMIKERDRHMITVSGDRVYDLALRLKYADLYQNIVEPKLEKAIKKSLDETKAGDTLYVLATYSAMLEVRKVLTGKKIL